MSIFIHLLFLLPSVMLIRDDPRDCRDTPLLSRPDDVHFVFARLYFWVVSLHVSDVAPSAVFISFPEKV